VTTQEKNVTAGDVARAAGGELSGDGGAPVADVTHDSRKVERDGLFVAVRGENFDAHRFVPQVLERGAAGVVSELERPADFRGAVWIRVKDVRLAQALAAAEVHKHPSKELNLVGITGTNGKTTTTYLVAAVAESAGEQVALTSTVEYRVGSERIKAERTTPESSDTQRLLRRAVEAGCRTAVMESSSQAIDLRRCDALHYAAAVFTNLTRDHLDYHGTMDNYFAAKRRLFDGSLGSKPRASVVNVDDERGARLAAELKAEGAHVVTYGLGGGAEITAREVEHSLEGMRLRLVTPEGGRSLRSPLVGRPHVYNILAAAGVGLALDYASEAVARAVETCGGAPGRFERVAHEGDFAVVVDYAHTDDALLNVLRTAREVAAGRVITLFGCGGDRDRSKRAPMGEAAASLSDVVILTSDNPRTEDPERIFSDIEEGLRHASKPYEKIADRREAIFRAVAEARAGDLVLIAGKGHEDYQIIGREVSHFDDREVAREALAARKGAQA
jgi:UDP-N-acetylmuramyl-tripeptide synthetase